MGVCFKGFEHIAQLLIEHGANVNTVNFNGATALIFAATFARTTLVKLLLNCGADASLEDDRGHSALDHAKIQGIREVITILDS